MDQSTLNRINEVRKIVAQNKFVTDGPIAEYKDQLPPEYIKRMQIISDKYREVRWLPLDIPRIELENIDEFKELWKEESISILRTKPDVAEPWSKEAHPYQHLSSWNTAQFNGLTIWQNPNIPIDSGTFAAKEYKGNSKQISRLVEQVFEYFPIHTMLSVFIWQSTMPIPPHRDKGAFWKCPTDFRVMLHDENDQPTLYVSDIEKGDTHYIDCPKDTNSFCWSNGTQIHGSDYHGKTKYLLCIAGIQHSGKSDELFARSIAKYRDQLNYELKL